MVIMTINTSMAIKKAGSKNNNNFVKYWFYEEENAHVLLIDTFDRPL